MSLFAQRKTSIVILAGALMFWAIASAALFYPPDFDAFWHLRHGLNILESNIWPSHDVLSFTYTGKEVAYSSPFFGVSLAVMYKILGDPLYAFTFYRLACFAAIFLLLFAQIRRYQPHWLVAIFGISLLTVFSANTLSSRAELFSIAMNGWLFYFLLNQKQLSNTLALALMGLMAFWSNWHITATIGFITVGSFYAQQIVTNYGEPRKIPRIIALGVVTFLIGFVASHRAHPLISVLFDFENFADLIMENRTLGYWSSNPSAHTVFFVTLVMIIFAVKQKNTFAILSVIALLLQMIRFEKIFLHMIPITMTLLNYYSKDILTLCRAPRYGKYIPVLASGIFIFNIFDFSKNIVTVSQRYSMGYFSANREERIIPYDLSEYIESSKLQGKVLNTFESGGYFTYRHWPDLKVFIDGRVNILYSKDFVVKYLAAAQSPRLFEELYRTDPFDVVIGNMMLPYTYSEWAIRRSGFYLDYVSKHHVVLKPTRGNYPLSTQLLVNPACLSLDKLPGLQLELAHAQKDMPSDSQLTRYLEFATSYLQAPQKPEFLTAYFKTADSGQRWANRAAGSLAFENNLPDLGRDIHMLNTFGFRFTELLSILKYDCHEKNCKNALDLFSHFKVTRIPKQHLPEMEKIIEEISQKQPQFKQSLLAVTQANIADYDNVNTETCTQL